MGWRCAGGPSATARGGWAWGAGETAAKDTERWYWCPVAARVAGARQEERLSVGLLPAGLDALRRGAGVRSRLPGELRSWVLDTLFPSSHSRGDALAAAVSALDSAEAGAVMSVS